MLFGGSKIVKSLIVKVDNYIHSVYNSTTTTFKMVVTFGVLQVVNEELTDVSWNGTVFGRYDLIHLWLTSSLSSTTGSSSSYIQQQNMSICIHVYPQCTRCNQSI